MRYGGFNFGNMNLADGRLMTREVLAAADDGPTAIFAANNFIAFGAVRALREVGLRVPDDISVVAFDDLPAEWVDEPFLTVAAQPAYDIGRRAAELMIDRLVGERTTAGESVVLPFEVIVRRSTAAPRARAGSGRPGPRATDLGDASDGGPARAGGQGPMTAERVEPVDPRLVPQRVVAGGATMPAIGLGTFGSDHVSAERVAAAVYDAIRLGYRHIDCASVYGNEHLIGESLERVMAEGVRREELWITSKLWNDNHDPSRVAPALERSLRDLRLDHLDLVPRPLAVPQHPSAGRRRGLARFERAAVSARALHGDLGGAREARRPRSRAAHRDLEHDRPEAATRPPRRAHPSGRERDGAAPALPAARAVRVRPGERHGPDRLLAGRLAGPPERDRTPDDSVDVEDPVIVAIARRLGVHPAVVCIKWAIRRGQVPVPFSITRANYHANLRGRWSMSRLRTPTWRRSPGIDRNCRLIKGQVFLWKAGQPWEDLWDLDGTITPP